MLRFTLEALADHLAQVDNLQTVHFVDRFVSMERGLDISGPQQRASLPIYRITINRTGDRIL